jgi:tetratricopeptide (TPR) repeat protein
MNLLLRLLALALAVGLTAGCGTLAPSAEEPAPAAADTATDAPEAEAAPPAGPDADLPRTALDADTLYSLLLGEIASRRGQIELAATLLARVAQKTRDPRVAERAALAGLYARRFNEALESARLWAEVRPKSVEARMTLGAILLELERTDEARTHFEAILKLAPADQLDNAYMRTVSVLGRHAKRNAALEIMMSLTQQHPRSPVAQFALSHLAVRSGDLDKGLSAINRALELKSDWDEAALFKARILVSQKDLVRADKFYEDYLARYPDSSTVRINYARHLIDLKRWDKAREQFERVVKSSPADPEAVYALGLLSMQTGRNAEAEKYLKQAVELRPDNHTARLYLGQLAENNKRYEEAARWYESVRHGDNYLEAQARYAVMLAKQGQLDAARAHLRKVPAEGEKQRVQLLLAEEQILRDAKRYQEAFDLLSAAIGRMPQNNELRYARALTAEKIGQLKVAESDLKDILARDPRHAHALNALGYTLADRTNRYAEAKGYLDRALAERPDDPFILDSMGWLMYRLGKHDEAVRYLRLALTKRSDAEIAAHLGEVLWVTGRRDEAKEIWNKALRETPDNEALLDVIKKFKP